jgi:hypothetical protein
VEGLDCFFVVEVREILVRFLLNQCDMMNDEVIDYDMIIVMVWFIV